MNVATRATGLDTKNVKVFSDNPTAEYDGSFLLTLKKRNWMKQSAFETAWFQAPVALITDILVGVAVDGCMPYVERLEVRADVLEDVADVLEDVGVYWESLKRAIGWTQWFLKQGQHHPFQAVGYVASVIVFVRSVVIQYVWS